MKLTLSNFFSIITVFFLGTIVTQAQEICIVTADFTNGTNYIVYWEQPDDITGLDSVIVYRKQSTDNIFSRIGAVNVGAGEQTFFEDAAANTIDVTKYAIAYKTDGGVIGALSPWHQPMVSISEMMGLPVPCCLLVPRLPIQLPKFFRLSSVLSPFAFYQQISSKT